MKYITTNSTSIVSPKLLLNTTTNKVGINESYKVIFDDSEFGDMIIMTVKKTSETDYYISFSSRTNSNHDYYNITNFGCSMDGGMTEMISPSMLGGNGKHCSYTIENVHSDILITRLYATLKHEPQLILNNFNSDVKYSFRRNYRYQYEIEIANIEYEEGDKIKFSYSISELSPVIDEMPITSSDIVKTFSTNIYGDVTATLIKASE